MKVVFLPPRYFWQSGYIQLETDNKQPVVQRSLCAAANLKIKLSASFIKGDNNSNLKSEGLAPYFDRWFNISLSWNQWKFVWKKSVHFMWVKHLSHGMFNVKSSVTERAQSLTQPTKKYVEYELPRLSEMSPFCRVPTRLETCRSSSTRFLEIFREKSK